MATGSQDIGESISLNLIKKRVFNRTPPTFEEAKISTRCAWCSHFLFKIGSWGLCKLHKEKRHKLNHQCSFSARGKYVKGMGVSKWKKPINRHKFSWFQELNYNEYNERIVILMQREKYHKDKQNRKRGLIRLETRKKKEKKRLEAKIKENQP